MLWAVAQGPREVPAVPADPGQGVELVLFGHKEERVMERVTCVQVSLLEN